MAYSERIKSFSRIREYMRDFVVYGFRTRTEYERKSARSYDNERRRVESWLKDAMAYRRDAQGKHVFVSVDNRTIPHNPLYAAFKAKSFTDNDITLHFLILDILADGEGLTVREIAETAADRIGSHRFSWVPDESTIRGKLREYEKLGVLTSRKRGREVVYERNAAPFDAERWRDALSFASECMPLGVIGSFLLDLCPEEKTILSFKHHYLIQALDAEILEDLAECRRKGERCRITFRGRLDSQENTLTVFPLAVYVSTGNGRHFLIAYSYGMRRPRMYRLDRIRKVERTGEREELTEEMARRLGRFAVHLYGVSSGPDDVRQLDSLSMTIRIRTGEGYVLERLLREKRNGTVTQVDEEHWVYTAQVYDAGEMLPWIRTFTGRITELSCSREAVEKLFREDLRAMYAAYGIGENGGGEAPDDLS